MLYAEVNIYYDISYINTYRIMIYIVPSIRRFSPRTSNNEINYWWVLYTIYRQRYYDCRNDIYNQCGEVIKCLRAQPITNKYPKNKPHPSNDVSNYRLTQRQDLNAWYIYLQPHPTELKNDPSRKSRPSRKLFRSKFLYTFTRIHSSSCNYYSCLTRCLQADYKDTCSV